MDSGHSTHSNPSDSPDDAGTDTGSWDSGSGEGSASALARMKNQERHRADSQGLEEGPGQA